MKIPHSLLFCILFAFSQPLCAQSGKALYDIIIDTDGAADDLRAICMMLSTDRLEVMAVTSSPGALPTEETALKTRALLREFHHEGIPVGKGRDCGQAPQWREDSRAIEWADTTGIGRMFPDATDVMRFALEQNDRKSVIVALGALTNLKDLLQSHPESSDRIRQIIWYSSQPRKGANYQMDKASADFILRSDVPITVVSSETGFEVPVDSRLIEQLDTTTRSGRKIFSTHMTPPTRQALLNGHFYGWDEFTAVYLLCPELFRREEQKGITLCTFKDQKSADRARDMIPEMLNGHWRDPNQLFARFPSDETLFKEDFSRISQAVLEKHGPEEYRAGILANELHGHMGIYAIIGVKMGLRAKEYFNLGLDDINILSYAGKKPPVSCMNDGLQVSTGATLGHGLIEISPAETPLPEADFSYKGRSVKIRMLPQIKEQIASDIIEGLALDSAMGSGYWNFIRRLALKYWLEFDRYGIFEVIPIE